MPNKNYVNGVRLERQLVNEARNNGWVAFRSAGSHSPWDVVQISPYASDPVFFTQCKRVKTNEQAKRLLKAFVVKPPMRISDHYRQCLVVYIAETREQKSVSV